MSRDELLGCTLVSKFAPGQDVQFRLIGQPGQKQRGTIEEVVFAYGMRSPIYVIEFWMDGSFNRERFHERDLDEA